MNVNHLSERLAAIAKEVPVQSRLADIGTDHGYLPVYLVRTGKIASALATDVNEGPLRSAALKIEKHKLQDQIITRRGDGLSAMELSDHIDVVVIAGMGGTLITHILENGKTKLTDVKRLILQPNVAANDTRRWMIENNWELIEEQIIEEDGRFYEILTAIPGDGTVPYKNLNMDREAGILFGPHLIRNQNSAFKKKWSREREKWEYVLQEIQRSNDAKATAAQAEKWKNRCKWLEEVYHYETS